MIRQAQTGVRCKAATLAEYSCLWNEIITLLGYKVTKETKEDHINYLRSLTAYTQQWYAHTAIDEIRLAYHVGVLGHLDIEMYATISPVQIGKVMKAYRVFREKELAQNPVAVTDTSRLLGGESTEQSEEQKEGWFLYSMQYAYWTLEHGHEYKDLANALYDGLDQRGLVSFTDERKWEFMMQAQEQLRKDAVAKSFKGSWQERKQGQSLAQVLADAIEQKYILNNLNDPIVAAAKQIAFTTLLKELIEQGVTIREFLGMPINEVPTINQIQDAA